MCAASPDGEPLPDTDRLLLVVVGAHLEAEHADRPLASRLREAILTRVREHSTPGGDLVPVICTDLWYLNAEALMARPTVSIGRPERNAVSAWFARRLPAALVIDQRLQIQLDPEQISPNACIWGADDRSTSSAIDIFVDRYLDQWLGNVLG